MKLLRETIRNLILQEAGVGFDQDSPVMKNYEIPSKDANQPLQDDTQYKVSIVVNNSTIEEMMTPSEILSVCQDLANGPGYTIDGIFIKKQHGSWTAAFPNEATVEYLYKDNSLVHADSGDVHYQ